MKLTIDVPTALLGIDQAIPCGLIINELVSNALKHAFPADGGRSGVIAPTDASGVGAILCDHPPSGCDRPADEITVRLRRDGRRARLVLTVADNGVGFPEGEDFRRTPSLGLQLVNTLVRQLGADIEIESPVKARSFGLRSDERILSRRSRRFTPMIQASPLNSCRSVI